MLHYDRRKRMRMVQWQTKTNICLCQDLVILFFNSVIIKDLYDKSLKFVFFIPSRYPSNTVQYKLSKKQTNKSQTKISINFQVKNQIAKLSPKHLEFIETYYMYSLLLAYSVLLTASSETAVSRCNYNWTPILSFKILYNKCGCLTLKLQHILLT